MRLKRKSAEIYLRINAYRAADLNSLDSTQATSRQVNASLVAQLNGFKKRSKRKTNTSNPSWDESFLIPLKPGDFSDLLVLSVLNLSGRSKVYMGEVRLRVSEIFENGPTDLKTSEQWYKLYLSEEKHGFVTGSLLLQFEVVLNSYKKRFFSRGKRHEMALNLSSANESSTDLSFPKSGTSKPKLRVSPPTEASMEEPSLTDTRLRDKFDEWLSLLVLQEPPISISPNEQGFYNDLPLALQMSDASDVSDLESIYDIRRRTSQASRDYSSLESKKQSSQTSLAALSIAEPENKSGDKVIEVSGSGVTESDALSVGSFYSNTGEASDIGLYNTSAKTEGKDGKRKRLFKKKLINVTSNYEFRNRGVKGVMFLEIVSASDLPPIKNFTRTSFDMDPFVVVTFGKKSFRTSWKRHNLNPIYNERLSFEILDHELNYNIQFSVLDKDHFSFHDQVADVTIPMNELVDIVLASDHTDKKVREAEERLNIHTCESGENSSVVDDEDMMEDTYSDASLSNIRQLERNNSKSSLVSNPSSGNPVIQIAEDGNLVKTRRKKFIRRKTSVSYVDTSLFKTLNLSLDLKSSKMAKLHSSTLKIRARYIPYDVLRKDFWKALLEQYDESGVMDYIELISFLDTLGSSTSDDLVNLFFTSLGKSGWGGDTLTHEEIIECLEKHILTENSKLGNKIFEIERCPICQKACFSKRDDLDIISHFATCASKDWSIVSKLLVSSFVTPQLASRRWFSKVLIKLTYGKYKLGSNSANILVQDRSTGLILEEKMSITVRLGIRLLYKGLDKAKTKRIRLLLRKLSIKQGIKFDHPSSARDIPSFIQFHKLDLKDCLISDPLKFETFNDFFYRKLKPNSRPVEAIDEDRIAVSPADCRCTTFASVNQATELWIKGRNFTVAKLFNGNFHNLEKTDLYNADNCCVGIFRLAPQDYHRFHSPVSGKIGPLKYIEGEYYTVNPMAIRSDLDVYGENVRVIVPIESEIFGLLVMVAVGAMMVGSTVITVEEGQEVKRGDEIGYFKFGGSTILLLFQKKSFVFDSDLLNNSNNCIETLVRVGQSIGHRHDVPAFERERITFSEQPRDFKLNIIRAITGGDVDVGSRIDSWESQNLKLTHEDVDLLVKDDEDDGYSSSLIVSK